MLHMSAAFDDLDAVMSAAIVTAYGEVAILRPRARQQYVERAADSDRTAVQIWGVFSSGPFEQPIKGQLVGNDNQGAMRLAGAKAEFWIGTAQVADMGFEPATGDLLELPGRPSEPGYAVSFVQRTDRGDLNLILTREDRHA
jgi:hypothetical protein